jgi:multicomponent K+:H+ antiporter subunit E
MNKLFPHPYLSGLLALIWVLMARSFSLGDWIMAAILATLIPIVIAAFWSNRPRIKSVFRLIRYLMLVIWDILVANFQVARIVVFMPKDQIKSAWISLPIDLKSPEAISLLAGTITLTPGTLTADFAADGKSLLIHSLHAPNPDAVRNEIKTRYEARLREIFE